MIAALVSLTAALIAFGTFRKEVILNKRSSLFITLTLMTVYSFIYSELSDILGYNSGWHYFLFYFISICISLPLAYLINKSAQQLTQSDCEDVCGADAGNSSGAEI
jgi:hypothetical protein